MFQPNDQISVALTASEWNQVLAVLAEGPFKVVMPLITKINEQAMRQDGADTLASDRTPAHVPN
jgi:hypothetical protein